MDTVDAMAIVGIGCRFPGAAGTAAFWKLLETGGEAVTSVPRDRFDAEALYSGPTPAPGRIRSLRGGFLDDVHAFDAAFFRISPREARTMDPQQRLLLHVVWEALEDAHIPPSSLAGSTAGVFVGQATAEYGEVLGTAGSGDIRALAGSGLRAVTSGRVSHALDLRGPSLTLDTACSSSLVAVHAARQSLLTGECDLAVAAGVNVILSPRDAIAYSQGEMLSPDGRCKFADASADGFVRSEGVGVVLLKRLPDAIVDGDPVHALLLGSAVTNDGRGSGLLLQPAVSGQVEMLTSAWRSAGISPDQLDYIEAHGTGTTVGDTVELRALAEALAGRDTARPLLTGSVKSNIGHAEAAAGIAGLIKTVLIARHRTVPASLHVTTPHPLIADAEFPVELVQDARTLEPHGERAVLGVSSFGLSGTNAHVVIGEYTGATAPEQPAGAESGGAAAPGEAELLVLSARSSASLRKLAERYAAHLEPGGAGRSHSLRELCRSAATGRDAHPFRLWAVGTSHDELARTLRELVAGEPSAQGGVHEAGFGGPRRVAFVFPGQGSQWRGMGSGLLASSPAFRTALEECDAAVREELDWSVTELLRGGEEIPDSVDVVQPALWAVEVALAAHWRSMGVDPDLCLGHSMGEAAAACVSGALSVRDAARVICRRSTLMQRLAGRGAMLATELAPERARELVTEHGEDRVCVAVENSSRATVLAGDADALAGIAAELERLGVFNRPVKVNVASHSPVMDELRAELPARLRGLRPRTPQIELFSTVRCETVRDAALDGAYWMDNLRLPVRFAESVRQIVKDGETVFVEVAPHPLLAQALTDCQEEAGVPAAVVSTLVRQQDESLSMLRALGRAFALGAGVDWRRVYGNRSAGGGTWAPLPSYAWQAEDLRLPSPPPAAAVTLPVVSGSALASAPALTAGGHERRVRLSRLGPEGFGGGVKAAGTALVPPVLYLRVVAEAVRDLEGDGPVTLEDVQLEGALPLAAPGSPEERRTVLRVALEPAGEEDAYRFTVDAIVDPDAAGAAVRCVSGTIRPGGRQDPVDLDGVLTRCEEYVPAAEFYRRAESRGYTVAPALRQVRQLWRREGEAVARLHTDGGGAAPVEAGLLAMLASWPQYGTPEERSRSFLPLSFERVYLGEDLDGEFWSTARFSPTTDPVGGGVARCDVVLSAEDGCVLAAFAGIALMPRGDGPAVPGADAAAPAAGVTSTVPAPTTAPASPPAPTGQGVRTRIAAVLGTSAERLDYRRPLADLGLDSLMAMQLRRILRTEFGAEFTPGRLLGGETAAGIEAVLADPVEL
ncbi:type I polyketide synthase [Streptomyces sp. Wb2n-11]|uniref:type I polyketide synthase n=1 Tax=Streptomyces sp. Wb2n-11 TaxID=1030533 RepID=UPI000AA834CC|nr:type I polyketide synthase [Streptomyces sp. Wb2n-11]